MKLVITKCTKRQRGMTCVRMIYSAARLFGYFQALARAFLRQFLVTVVSVVHAGNRRSQNVVIPRDGNGENIA